MIMAWTVVHHTWTTDKWKISTNITKWCKARTRLSFHGIYMGCTDCSAWSSTASEWFQEDPQTTMHLDKVCWRRAVHQILGITTRLGWKSATVVERKIKRQPKRNTMPQIAPVLDKIMICSRMKLTIWDRGKKDVNRTSQICSKQDQEEVSLVAFSFSRIRKPTGSSMAPSIFLGIYTHWFIIITTMS